MVSSAVLNEFIPQFLKNPEEYFKNKDSVISKLIVEAKQVKAANQALIQILKAINKQLTAIDKKENKQVKQLVNVKTTLFPHINFAQVNKEDFNDLALIIIDTWNIADSNFTQSAALYLSLMIRRIAPNDLFACVEKPGGNEVLKIGTLILLKAIQGEDLDLVLSANPSPGYLAMLAAQYLSPAPLAEAGQDNSIEVPIEPQSLAASSSVQPEKRDFLAVVSQMQEPLIDINQNHDELIADIAARMLTGHYKYSFIWCSIIQLHQSTNWSLPDSSKVQKILQDTIEHCEYGIKQGCPNAMTLRGFMYLNGLGGKKEYTLAIEQFDRAIEHGSVPALIERALMHVAGLGGKIKRHLAIELLDRAIEAGNLYAMAIRASMYFDDEPGGKNNSTANQLLDWAIASGDSSAMVFRASLIMECADSEEQVACASKLLDDAVERNDLHAMCHRAMFYSHQQLSDLESAIKLLDKAAALGYLPAMVELAKIYLFVRIDVDSAIALLDQAIALDYPPAMYERAMIYLSARDGEVDYASAIKLLDRAAALDYLPAISQRALLHQQGRGGAIDHCKAARLLRNYSNLVFPMEQNTLEFRKNDNIFYMYHHLIAQSDFDKVADLIIGECPALLEFFGYELPLFFKNPKAHFQKIATIVSMIAMKGKDTNFVDSMLINLLFKIAWEEKTQGSSSKHMQELKVILLSQIKAEMIPKGSFYLLAEIITDTWNHAEDKFTENAAQCLSLMIRKTSSRGKNFLDDRNDKTIRKIIEKSTAILLKAIHGEEAERFSPKKPSYGYLAMLATQYVYRVTPAAVSELTQKIIRRDSRTGQSAAASSNSGAIGFFSPNTVETVSQAALSPSSANEMG